MTALQTITCIASITLIVYILTYTVKKHTKDSDPMKPYYKHIDCDGKKVEHLITFQEFQDKFLEHYISTCHNFTNTGFLFDEGGVYGFNDMPVGFKTKADQRQYAEWRKQHPEQKYTSRACMKSNGITQMPY